MTIAPTSLVDASWLKGGPVQAVFAALAADGDEVRVVGGAVRNALIGAPVVDIDFATTAQPEIVAARSRSAGFKVVPTGVDHGTLTVIVDGQAFEVTTLREDVETDGRHAVVRFGRDWLADASRRDFTVNALYVDAAGTVFDPLGGYDDLRAGCIRFIGIPARRIAEDRLRILRFFRFHAQYGKGALDEEGLAASIRAREDLRSLSGERIGREMRELVAAVGAVPTFATMQDTGILPIVLGGVGYVANLRRLLEFETSCTTAPSVPLRLAALGCRIEEDVFRLTERLRLSNQERDRMRAAISAIDGFLCRPDERCARRMLYRLGREAYADGVALAFSWSGDSSIARSWRDLHELPRRSPVPSFPLGGRDVLGLANVRGPAVGALLKQLESWWIDGDFTASEADLRSRLQQMVAAAQ